MSKKNLILLAILIILVGLAWVYQGPFQEWQKDWGKPKNFLEKIDLAQVNKVVVTRIVASTTLEKSGDRWKVAGTKDFFVKNEVAEEMMTKIGDAQKAEFRLISSNPDKKKDFKTEDILGTKVDLYRGEERVAGFVIGKMGNDFKSTYISRSGDNNTYAVEVFLTSPFERTDWRDDTVFSSDKEKIAKLRFQYPNREFTVEKKDGKWEGTMPFKFPVNAEKIGKVLEIMSGLTAVAIPAQDFKGTDLEKNLIIVEASGDGVNNLLMVGTKNDSGNYYAKRGDSDNIYLITKEQRDTLDQTIEKLK